MLTSPCDATEQTERALLGSVMLDNSLWPQTESVSADDFLFESHRRIYRCMASMAENKRPIDETTLPAELQARGELQSIGGFDYIGVLLDGVVPENFSTYVRDFHKAAQERTFARQYEQLGNTRDNEERLALVSKIGETLQNTGAEGTWRSMFHSRDEVMNAPEARFAIDGFLQEDGITLIGALPGHGKTLCMLEMVRALLEGGRLFQHFTVKRTADRVIYLIPEAGLSPFSMRLKTFGLTRYVEERLFPRTLSMPGELPLTDPRLKEAVKGADVFLDTAIRFMTGDENSAAEQKIFADTLFGLQRAGARTITGAHHSPKSFGTQMSMTLENVLRGSGD